MKERIMNEEEKQDLVEKIFARIETGHELIDQVYCVDDFDDEEREEVLREVEEFLE